jgi:endonuclease/exonuclease/phosphatase family metal-dependent hydrolase
MEIRITSLNIRFDNPKDGKNSWQNRRQLAADAVQTFQTNILATQEGRYPQIKDFNTLLPRLQLADSHRFWIRNRMYPCIFFDPKFFDHVHSEDIWLSTTPKVPGSKSFGSLFPRLGTFTILKEKISNQKILFVNTHLDHMNEMTRFYQINVLVAQLNQLQYGKMPVVFAGDFNSSPEDSVRFEIMNKMRLVDPWELLGLPEISSYHRFQGRQHSGSRIDWILHSNDSLKTRFIQLNKMCKNGVYPSDHFPVQARIKLKSFGN